MKRARIILAALAVGLGVVTAMVPISSAQATPRETVETVQVPSYNPVTGQAGTVEALKFTNPGPLAFSACSSTGWFCIWIDANGQGPWWAYGQNANGLCLVIGTGGGVNFNNNVSSVWNRRFAGQWVRMFDLATCNGLLTVRVDPNQYGNVPGIFNDRASSIYFHP